MRALAEFIMRSRFRAVLVAVLGIPLPLLSQAVISLVTLRRGHQEGSLILISVLLPILAMVMTDGGDLLIACTGGALVVSIAGAVVLRATVSWSVALTALVAVSTAMSLVIAGISAEQISAAATQLGNVIAGMQAELPEEQRMAPPGGTFVVALISYLMLLNAVASLLLARWWQSLLYNPGGFQVEFHHLKLLPWQTLVCLGASIYCWVQGGDYQPWALVFQMPLLISGISLVHWLVKNREMGGGWLGFFYVALVLFSPLQVMLVVLAASDTWIDIRARLTPGNESSE